jgi:hypothetical protein
MTNWYRFGCKEKISSEAICITSHSKEESLKGCTKKLSLLSRLPGEDKYLSILPGKY